jgi:hypothetical protein
MIGGAQLPELNYDNGFYHFTTNRKLTKQQIRHSTYRLINNTCDHPVLNFLIELNEPFHDRMIYVWFYKLYQNYRWDFPNPFEENFSTNYIDKIKMGCFLILIIERQK